jgi:hypothetical protein
MSNVFTYQLCPLLKTRAEWRTTTATESGGPIFRFELMKPPSWPPEKKEWASWIVVPAGKVRERFFALQSPEDAFAFFTEFGPWELTGENTADPIAWQQVLAMQELFKKKLLEVATSKNASFDDNLAAAFKSMYLSQSPNLTFSPKVPRTIDAICPDIKEAVRTCNYLDHEADSIWRRCAREDCGKLFQATGKRKRLYCNNSCTHLSNVRAGRQEKRKTEVNIRPVGRPRTKGQKPAAATRPSGRKSLHTGATA